MCSEPRNVSACSIADGNFDHLVMWLLPGFSTVGKKICVLSGPVQFKPLFKGQL